MPGTPKTYTNSYELLKGDDRANYDAYAAQLQEKYGTSAADLVNNYSTFGYNSKSGQSTDIWAATRAAERKKEAELTTTKQAADDARTSTYKTLLDQVSKNYTTQKQNVTSNPNAPTNFSADPTLGTARNLNEDDATANWSGADATAKFVSPFAPKKAKTLLTSAITAATPSSTKKTIQPITTGTSTNKRTNGTSSSGRGTR